MKRTSTPSNWLLAALAGLALAFATSSGLAASDRVLNTFDGDISGWGDAWGNAAPSFDPAQDNTGNGGGSCYISGDYSQDQNTMTIFGNQPPNGTWWFPGPSFNMSDYVSLEFDIKWDTSKSLSIADFNANPGGDGGIAIWATDYPGFTIRPTLGTVTVPAAAATGWTHVSLAINPTISGIDPSVGIVFKKWITPDTKTAGGTYAFWVDNVILKGTAGPPPPPSVSLDPHPVLGMNFVAASGGQWDRQTIRTVGANYSWIGAPGPVTYSFDVAKLSDTAHSGFQIVVYVVPGTPDPTRADSDWHETNVVYFNVTEGTDGSGWASLHVKTNAPDSNGNMFGPASTYPWGYLGGQWNASALGTWSLTFNQDTNVTITAPSGGSFTTNLPPEVVSLFSATPGMQFSIGCMPGDPARLGQIAVVTGVKITGAPGEPNLNSDFLAQPRDTNAWMIVATSANYGVQQISTNAACWVNWTLPANGFILQTKPALGPGAWTDSTLTGYEVGGFHTVLCNKSDLPGTSSGYFRLLKRTATQLQVLLPGETSAPGTTTGKTGTPLPQTAGNPFDITINMCDPTWHIVSSSDTVAITSDDTTAFTPPNTTLAGGTVTITANFFFGSSGTWTITATDASNSAITAGTSTAITIP